jgi:hypothetical protein
MYRGDARRGVDSSIVTQTKNFDIPIRKKRAVNIKFRQEQMYILVLLPISSIKMLTNGVPKHGI